MTKVLLWCFMAAAGAAVAAKLWWPRPSYSALSAPVIPPVQRTPYDPALTHKTVEFWASEVRRDPRGSLALSNLAQWYLRSYRETGDMADILRAEQAAHRSLSIRRSNYDGLIEVARCLMTQHRFRESLTTASRATVIDPDNFDAYALQAETQMELGDYAASKRTLYSHTLKPGDTNAKALRARLCEIEGNPAQAINYYRQAQREADANLDMPCESVAWYHTRLGNCLAGMGRATEAAQAYHEALKLFPHDYRTMTSLARLAAGRNDWRTTITWGRKAAAIVPTPETVALIGDAEAGLGHADEAARQYQLVEAIGSLASANGVIYDRQRTLFYADHDRHQAEAYALAKRELQARQDIYAYDTFAWAAYKVHRLTEAVAVMRKALAHHTQDALLYYHAGVIEAAAGQRAQAKRDLTRALTLNPYFHPTAPRQTRALLAKLG